LLAEFDKVLRRLAPLTTSLERAGQASKAVKRTALESAAWPSTSFVWASRRCRRTFSLPACGRKTVWWTQRNGSTRARRVTI